MSDSPDSLVLKPEPNVRKGGGRIMYLLIAAGVIVFGVLVYSVQFGSKPDPEEEQQQELARMEHEVADTQPALPAPERETGLVEVPESKSRGLANPDSKADPDALPDNEPLVTVVNVPSPPPAYLARQQALEKVRKNKQKALEQALAAPMKVAVGATRNSNRAKPATSADILAAGVRQRHPMPSMASLNPAPEQAGNSDREEKEAFLEQRAKVESSQWQLPYDRIPGTACELKTGTVISGIMLSGINSDLPGHILAQVSRNIYDTATGAALLIPQGSRLIGLYDSRIVSGQERVLVAWNRVIFPDGSSITLGAMPGVDMAGYTGFSDLTDNHYLRVFGSAVIMSLISGVSAYAMDTFTSATGTRDNPSLQDEMGSALSQELGQSSMNLLRKNANIKPTLEIRPGYRFSMVVTKDIVFEAPYEPLPPRTYRRNHALD